MNFLYPLFLLGGLAIAIPIVLHLLRRDVAPQVPFSAVRLLRRSPIERSRRRRLRDLLLLAARVAALLLLATAFARPYRSNAAAGPDLRIVAVDRSFSMGAPGRFARAIDAARDAIDAAGAGERVALIAFDDRADVLAAAGPPSDARAALAALQPGFGGTRFGTAVAKAVELAGADPARLVVVTDLQRAGWEDEQQTPVPAGFAVEVKDVGGTDGNVAVTALRVEPDRVVASVRNAGSQPFDGRVRVMLAEQSDTGAAETARQAASARVSVAGGEETDVAIPMRAAGGSLAVAIDDPGGYPADDVRYTVLGAQPGTRVLLMSAGSGESGFYVSRALASAVDDDAFDVREIDGRALPQLPELEAYPAIVLLSTRGLDRRGRETLAAYVRSGGGLFVAASPDVDPGVMSTVLPWPEVPAVGEPDQPVRLAPTDLRHPIFRPFGALAANLGQVRFDRAWRVRADGWEAAARFTDGSPALIERREGAGRVVLFASDVDRQWNDFPLHPAFVPFVVETVRHVAGAREWTRDYLVADAPAGARPQPGVYVTARENRRVAVNVDPREGATARLTAAQFEDMLQRVEQAPADSGQAPDVRSRQAEARQGLWRYGLLLMLAALVAESFVGRVP